MVIAPLSLKKDYWQNFDVEERDLEYLYSYLLDVEQPQTSLELAHALAVERIRRERQSLEKQQQAGGMIYYPKDRYEVGQSLTFPTLDWQSGKVVRKREGVNPELPPFEVIEVEMENGGSRSFASGIEEHVLNQPISVDTSDPMLNIDYVIEHFGSQIEAKLSEMLEANADLVRIARKWFPRALLVDINVGHLNLAEAVLDMMGGGPLDTRSLMEQIDLPTDAEANLNEFSLNLAMQEDKRFDEVGPTGEVLWYLYRLEPDPVREAPVFLRYSPSNDRHELVDEMLTQFEPEVIDELEPALNEWNGEPVNEATINLIYPHWRSGTLPLAGSLVSLFPTAYESPRIQFTFVDGNSGEKFSGWVVRPLHYVYGLREWYLSQGLNAGSIVHVSRSRNPGEVVIRADKKRGSREWIRTAIVGSDGGIVFSMLKHNITAAVDERMAIIVSDVEAHDKVWEKVNKQRSPLPQTVRMMMTELAKLSPQSHVHAQELYAAMNILRRCPPGAVLSALLNSPWAAHLGNLYFRMEDPSGGDHD